MKLKFRYAIAGAMLFALSGFNSAKAITADELLVLFQAYAAQVGQGFLVIGQVLGNHEARIASLENANPNLGGYSMGFSGDGAPKNVVLATQDDGFGGTYYYVRSRYASSTEEISINGVLTQRPFIANYAFAHVDDLGNLLSVSNYIEAPDTANYEVFNVEDTRYDPVTLVKTVWDDTLKEDWNLCTYSTTTICIPEVTFSATGDLERRYTFSSIRSVSGPVTVNGLTFNDVRLEQSISSNNARARAQGVGEVLRVANDGSWQRQAIFYRANGVEGGSLAGTPFAAGQALDGLFF